MQRNYNFTVNENQAIGAEIGIVKAWDWDTPPNDEIEFTLFPNDTFSLSSNGTLRNVKDLTRDSNAVYNLTAVATNTAPPFLTSSVPVTVYVFI